MATTAEFSQVKAAYDKYVGEISVAPTNPTQLIRYCQKEGIGGITWSKCSKFFKSLNGPTGHNKSSSGPLLNNKSNNKQSSTHSAADTSSESPMIVVTPPNAPVSHKRTQSAHTPRTREKLLQNGVTPEFKAMNGKFTDLKEEPEPGPDTKHDDEDEFELNGDDHKEHDMHKPMMHSKVSSPRKQFSKPQSKRISLTPPGMKASTSFKTLPLDNDHAPSSSMKTTPSKRVSIIKKHSLMSKPWNKNKPPLWPRNR